MRLLVVYSVQDNTVDCVDGVLLILVLFSVVGLESFTVVFIVAATQLGIILARRIKLALVGVAARWFRHMLELLLTLIAHILLTAIACALRLTLA